MIRVPSSGRFAALLLLALVCMGAAVPRTGGVARVYLPVVPGDPNPEALPSSSDVFLSSSVFQSLVRVDPDGSVFPALARSWVVTDLPESDAAPGPADSQEGPEVIIPPEALGLRWVFVLDPLARFANGRAVTAEDVVASWQTLLTAVRSPYRWLLDPVVGAREYRRGESTRLEGVVADGGLLEIRLTRPVPDLLQRLAHPALGVRVVQEQEVQPEDVQQEDVQEENAREERAPDLGAGPFNVEGVGTLVGVNAYHARGRPFLDGIVPVEPQQVDPSLILESGQADVAVLYGRSAGQILSSPTSGIQMERLPGWDRVYALVWNSAEDADGGRTGLPAGLLGTLDRPAMLRYLFDQRGEPVRSLLPGSPHGAEVTLPQSGPMSGRISVLYDAADPAATSIASRLKASWEEVNLRVDLEGLRYDDLWYRLASGDYLAAVLLHHPPTTDPVLGLRGTLSRLGERAAPSLRGLDVASRLDDPAARLQAARAAESLLLRDDFLVPLVRVHAWLAVSPSLVGVQGGAAGILHLEDAWWLPGRRTP